MKAVTKFKNLGDKKRPHELDISLAKGDSNPLSSVEPVPPKPAPHTAEGVDVQDRPNAEAALASEGIYHEVTRSTSSSAGPIRVDSSGASKSDPNRSSKAPTATPPSHGERSDSSDAPKHDRPEWHRTSSSDKGHAHDPLTDEPLFLGIGAGKSDSLDVPDDDVIAESPLAAEFSIYDLAYEQEVERIRAEQGRRATVYLNRRVDGKEEYKVDENMVRASTHPGADKAQHGWGKLLDRMREKGTEPPSGA
jgi:[calcium/calmodulin-dependent protein kinase] kinase